MNAEHLLRAVLGAILVTSACQRSTSVGAAGRPADAEMDAEAETATDAGDADTMTPPLEALCTTTGGAVTTASCCMNGTASFPNTCSIGACSCPPASSHTIPVCDCPGGCFSPDAGCVQR